MLSMAPAAETAGTAIAPLRSRPDPRTKLLLLALTSVALLSPRGSQWVAAGFVMTAALLASARLWRPLLAFVVAMGIGLAILAALPLLGRHAALGILGAAVSYLVRLLIVAATAWYLTATTLPMELTAALRALRVARAVVVPLTVVVRFVPTVVAEARAVRDAMRLRGVAMSGFGIVRSPITSLEYFVVPLIASCLRIAEDLSASALLRGLGSRSRPTAMVDPQLGPADAGVLALAAVLVVVTVTGVWPW
jgi:energy-coupling factor transport system permease protein